MSIENYAERERGLEARERGLEGMQVHALFLELPVPIPIQWACASGIVQQCGIIPGVKSEPEV